MYCLTRQSLPFVSKQHLDYGKINKTDNMVMLSVILVKEHVFVEKNAENGCIL